ncbi:MAG: hypothetical protein HGA46_04145 [Chlorobiaceae bacterium]|nr:hypothetical protein [Chlorobiaceae bacterium]
MICQISFAIAWYEQNVVTVLLVLLSFWCQESPALADVSRVSHPECDERAC